MGEWQPIENAPRDGSEILISWNFHGQWYVMIGSWEERGFYGAHWASPPANVCYAPTDLPLLWRTLPAPPSGVEWAYSNNDHPSHYSTKEKVRDGL